MRTESRTQDLCEDLVKNEIAHAVMREKNKIVAAMSLLEKYELCYL